MVFDITARGKIKYGKNDILTGDFVEVENGAITRVYPRFSRFTRPNIANVECLVIVICDKPAPDFLIFGQTASFGQLCRHRICGCRKQKRFKQRTL